MDVYSKSKSLGRFTLRSGAFTVAAGVGNLSTLFLNMSYSDLTLTSTGYQYVEYNDSKYFKVRLVNILHFIV